ncbi:MAG: hypothetical protein U0457_12365 [Candidatus Sericytochromatia bacterium]
MDNKSTLTLEERLRVENADLETLIKITFPDSTPQSIHSIIDEIDNIKWINEKEKIKRYCLVISEGEIEKLKKYFEYAKIDYRDVIAAVQNTLHGHNLLKTIANKL